MFDFETQNAIGKKGETLVKKYYESKIDFLVDFIIENKFIKAIEDSKYIEQYITKNEINYFRNNPEQISEAVGVDKAIKLDAMMNYRKLPKDLRREAAVVFKQRTYRMPTLKYSNEELNLLIPNYDNLSEIDQAYELNELKLKQLTRLYINK